MQIPYKLISSSSTNYELCYIEAFLKLNVQFTSACRVYHSEHFRFTAIKVPANESLSSEVFLLSANGDHSVTIVNYIQPVHTTCIQP